jgi:hypothetical protein
MARTSKPTNGTSDAPKPVRPTRKGNGVAIDFNEAIARRAYEIYLDRGGSHGADLDDWLEAERQLRRVPSDITGGPAPAKPRRRKTPEPTAP